MCGIAGYVGPRKAVDVVFDQLKRLEYRGYDSAGVAYLGKDGIEVVKRAGKLNQLTNLMADGTPDVHLAIAHSRWATHGAPTDLNAHPHFDQFEKISIIHNGIIENYLELKAELTKEGNTFHSDTDTEVAAHVIGQEYAAGVSLEEALRRGVRKLRGAYAIVVMSKTEPEKIVCARNASPLVIGIGEGENLLASDIPALLPYTRKVLILDNDRIAVLTPDALVVTDLDGHPQSYEATIIDWDVEAAEKGGYEHFMLKEVHEQPNVVRQCLAGRIDETGRARLENVFGESVWNQVDRINIVACGTSYHAGLMGKYLFEKLLKLPTDVFHSSEFRYGDPVLSPNSLAILISQSGETADTLAALKLCQEKRIRTLGIVNVIGSSIARECDRTIITQAGPEISVASTKAYVAQVIGLTLLALHVAEIKEMPGVRVEEMTRELQNLPEMIAKIFSEEDKIIEIAERLQDAKLMFFLGRGADSLVALEGALKMKEIAYVATQESPAGEMKHGPLALVEDGVFAIMGGAESDMREKLASNMKEIQARGGQVVAITSEEDQLLPKIAEMTIKVPKTKATAIGALLTIVPMQLLAYHVARLKGCEIDQPRNLAKSVTVE
jgi:glucosamine--fructose-6-phosphate aminotransferase (isomerizing)